jgi:hypothetical protein
MRPHYGHNAPIKIRLVVRYQRIARCVFKALPFVFMAV